MNNLIYDRTQQDIIKRTAKGYYNYTDLNRIEAWCEYLSNTLNSYAYPVHIKIKTDWTIFNFPIQSEMERIRSNIRTLKNAFFSFTKIPENLEKMTFIKANDIEKILYEINTLIENMISQFFYCGEIYSGEV